MADSPFELQIDDDWKKQAQAEKRRLADEAEKKKATVAQPAKPAAGAAGSAAPGSAPHRRRGREVAEPTFQGLVDTLSQQVRLYLGAVPVSANGEGIVDLDAARQHMDLLAVVETKTAGNLSQAEQSALDVALYEARSRFSAVASRYIL